MYQKGEALSLFLQSLASVFVLIIVKGHRRFLAISRRCLCLSLFLCSLAEYWWKLRRLRGLFTTISSFDNDLPSLAPVICSVSIGEFEGKILLGFNFCWKKSKGQTCEKVHFPSSSAWFQFVVYGWRMLGRCLMGEGGEDNRVQLFPFH